MVLYQTRFAEYYKVVTRRPLNLVQALIKIGGLLAIFKIASVLLTMIHQRSFEKILKESISSNEAIVS